MCDLSETVGLETLATSPKRARGANLNTTKSKHSVLNFSYVLLDFKFCFIWLQADVTSGNCWLSGRREQETIWIHCFTFDWILMWREERESRRNMGQQSCRYIKTQKKVQKVYATLLQKDKGRVRMQNDKTLPLRCHIAKNDSSLRSDPVSVLSVLSVVSGSISYDPSLAEASGAKGWRGHRERVGPKSTLRSLRSGLEVLEAIRTLRTPTEWLAL